MLCETGDSEKSSKGAQFSLTEGSAIAVGSVVEGVVRGITHFGAFIELPNGKTGLVHISEVAHEFVRDVNDFLKENDKVQVKVLSYDDKGKIGLSIKQADASYRPPPPKKRRPPQSFEDKLARFMKESDERLTDLRRNTESRKGPKGRGFG